MKEEIGANANVAAPESQGFKSLPSLDEVFFEIENSTIAVTVDGEDSSDNVMELVLHKIREDGREDNWVVAEKSEYQRMDQFTAEKITNGETTGLAWRREVIDANANSAKYIVNLGSHKKGDRVKIRLKYRKRLPLLSLDKGWLYSRRFYLFSYSFANYCKSLNVAILLAEKNSHIVSELHPNISKIGIGGPYVGSNLPAYAPIEVGLLCHKGVVNPKVDKAVRFLVTSIISALIGALVSNAIHSR